MKKIKKIIGYFFVALALILSFILISPIIRQMFGLSGNPVSMPTASAMPTPVITPAPIIAAGAGT